MWVETCLSRAPEGPWECRLAKGHDELHRAYFNQGRWVVLWGWKTQPDRVDVVRVGGSREIPITHDVAFCLEHEQPVISDATHCGFVYWLESRHTVEMAAYEARLCRVVPAVLTVDGQ